MKFRNKSPYDLTVVLRGVTYRAPAHGDLVPDVPDKLAYAVKARGLPLEAIDGPPGEETIGPPEHPEARLWFDRAHEERRLLKQAAEENEQLRTDRERILAEHATAVEALKAGHAKEIAALKLAHEADLADLTAPTAEAPPAAESATPETPKAKRK